VLTLLLLCGDVALDFAHALFELAALYHPHERPGER
jgi:hypothetical protein